MAFGSEENETRFGARDEQLDPALLAVERLVGCHFEAKLLGEKLQGPVLIGDGNADEFNASNHGAILHDASIGTSIAGRNCPVIAILLIGIAWHRSTTTSWTRCCAI
jgi:hypothetical protein